VTLWYVDQIVHQSFEVRLERTHSEQFGVQWWSGITQRRKDPRGFSDTRETSLPSIPLPSHLLLSVSNYDDEV